MKGLDYKQGPVPTMMIAVAAKEAWKDKDGAPAAASAKKSAAVKAPAVQAAEPAPVSGGINFSAEMEAPDVAEKPKVLSINVILCDVIVMLMFFSTTSL